VYPVGVDELVVESLEVDENDTVLSQPGGLLQTGAYPEELK